MPTSCAKWKWALASLLPAATLLQVQVQPAHSEMLVVSDVACPPAMPDEVCFMTNGVAQLSTIHKKNIALPRDETIEYVQLLLQEALQVEHGTIPLYLTTLYSMYNQSSFEANTIRGVVMEEMLHMVQAANVLNAIGEFVFFAFVC